MESGRNWVRSHGAPSFGCANEKYSLSGGSIYTVNSQFKEYQGNEEKVWHIKNINQQNLFLFSHVRENKGVVMSNEIIMIIFFCCIHIFPSKL